MTRIVFSFIAVLLAASAFAVDLTDSQRAEIEARIAPVGENCMLGDNSCGGAAAPVASSGPRSGEDVYNAACMACHSTGAGGAPKVGDVAAWAERIAKGIPAAKLVVIPHSGHLCTLEEPTAVNAALEPFLTAHSEAVE